jgi:uncharacterized protein (DUF1778 family)
VIRFILAVENTEKEVCVIRCRIETMKECALIAAKPVSEEADHVRLSARDRRRVLDLLENPPAPNPKLLAAGQALPRGA